MIVYGRSAFGPKGAVASKKSGLETPSGTSGSLNGVRMKSKGSLARPAADICAELRPNSVCEFSFTRVKPNRIDHRGGNDVLFGDRQELVLYVVEFRKDPERIFGVVDLTGVVKGEAPKDRIIRADVVVDAAHRVVFRRDQVLNSRHLVVAAQIA